MSDESDQQMFIWTVQKRKRSIPQIEDSDSSSDDSSFEHRKHKRLLVSDIFELPALCFSSETVAILASI
jgi:hypothetical protein